MQEQVVDRSEAKRVKPSWYLCRDGQQHGPLTDQELSLFAEGGNFQPNDLLWTEGLDSWKPAHAIFGLKASPDTNENAPAKKNGETGDAVFAVEPSSEADDGASLKADAGAPANGTFELPASPEEHTQEDHTQEIVEPHGEDVDALVQALKGRAEPPKRTVTERVLLELKAFAGSFIYLWVVFTVLLLHEWIVLSDNHIGFTFYGLATINALALGKVMLVAEHLRFAEQLKRKPLIYPIAYKTVAFTTLLLVTYVVEMMLVGWIGGHGFFASMPALGGSLVGTAALWLIFCVALLPFFAFKEFERAVGAEMIWKLLLGAR